MFFPNRIYKKLCLIPGLCGCPGGYIVVKTHFQSGSFRPLVILFKIGIHITAAHTGANINDTYSGCSHLFKIYAALPLTDVDSFLLVFGCRRKGRDRDRGRR